ncbi:hypothetical protein [Pseudomonas sp. MPB23]|jgi:hypothetical protein|uniref:hypothetical protein n=1 Tax=Pseudomonas sp. MPB23 TaxID=3388490 RepID=UPI00398496BE
MTLMLPNIQNPFFNTGLMVDAVTQHVEAQINQKNAVAPQRPEPPSFPFNGTEYQAPKSRPTLIPYARIG